MDGPTATRAIRQLGYHAPIFGLTGNTAEGDRSTFIASGATQVLPKPFVYETFMAAMHRLSYV
jgi:CheY-like chemotaxis protein